MCNASFVLFCFHGRSREKRSPPKTVSGDVSVLKYILLLLLLFCLGYHGQGHCHGKRDVWLRRLWLPSGWFEIGLIDAVFHSEHFLSQLIMISILSCVMTLTRAFLYSQTGARSAHHRKTQTHKKAEDGGARRRWVSERPDGWVSACISKQMSEWMSGLSVWLIFFVDHFVTDASICWHNLRLHNQSATCGAIGSKQRPMQPPWKSESNR